MSTNSIILQNVSPEDLKQIISDVIEKKLINFQSQHQAEITYKTRKEVSELLKISLPTLNEYTKKGKLKGYRIGGRVLYRTDDIENSIKEIETLKYKRG
ncbi:helix-turn-helix domain-containing protein [Bacteroidota bacterium]